MVRCFQSRERFLSASPTRPRISQRGLGGLAWILATSGNLIAMTRRSFKQAKLLMRKLGVTSWEAFVRSGKKPRDIPAKPWKVYADEWKRHGGFAWHEVTS